MKDGYVDLRKTRHTVGIPTTNVVSQTSILQNHLSSHDAEITSSLLELSQPGTSNGLSETYLIVPHTSSQSDIPSTHDSSSQPTTVTDMWIERCLHRKAFVQPQDNVTSTPMSRFPICGMCYPDLPIAHFTALSIGRLQRDDGLYDCFQRYRLTSRLKSRDSDRYASTSRSLAIVHTDTRQVLLTRNTSLQTLRS